MKLGGNKVVMNFELEIEVLDNYNFYKIRVTVEIKGEQFSF